MSDLVMAFHVKGQEHDVSEVSELSVSLRDLGTAGQRSKTFRSDDARLIAGRLFEGPVLDMKGTYVGAMITAQIHLTFKDGGTVAFDVYNDRLAVDRVSEAGYDLSSAFRSLKETIY